MMQALVERARQLLQQGAALSQMVDQELSVTLDSFARAARRSWTASPRRITMCCAGARSDAAQETAAAAGALLGRFRVRPGVGVRAA